MKFLVMGFYWFRMPNSQISNSSDRFLNLMEIFTNKMCMLLIIIIQDYVSIATLSNFS